MEHTILPALSPVQAQVALSLASGASISTAAQSADLSRTTIYSWLQNEPNFSAAVEQAKSEFVLTLRDQLRDAAAKALATIIAIMDDPKAPASVRLKASLAILNRPQFPSQGWNLPEKIGEPNQEGFLENMAALEASHRCQRLATELNTSEQNFENSSTPKPPLTNKAPRNKIEHIGTDSSSGALTGLSQSLRTSMRSLFEHF